jgi:2-amino-4-hydroxy-6-hydroxymethyldihydropteridine diphosphokinase
VKIEDVFVGLGSNMGDRLANLIAALKMVQAIPGTELRECSAVYENPPYGYLEQQDFMNMAVKVATGLGAELFFEHLQSIEKEMGRVKEIRWGPRIIDLDLLFFDQLVIETGSLTIPHPEALNRAFVLIPLADIAPDFVPPGSDEAINQIKKALAPQTGFHYYKSSVDFFSDLNNATSDPTTISGN